jgi:signal peptidase I
MFENLFKAYELTRGAIVLAVMVALVYLFIGEVATIDGPSMESTLTNGSSTFVDKLSYAFAPPRRGDVVNLRFPGDPDKTRYVKRIVAMPGEQVRVHNDQIFVDNEAITDPGTAPYRVTDGLWQLQDDQYFLVGDNLANSNDSRVFGPVERRFIIGKLRFVIWPPTALKTL